MSEHDPICEARLNEYPSARCVCTEVAEARADERERVTDVLMRATEDGMVQALREWKAELRAKIEALTIAHHYGGERGWCVRIADVLALIDGGGDE